MVTESIFIWIINCKVLTIPHKRFIDTDLKNIRSKEFTGISVEQDFHRVKHSMCSRHKFQPFPKLQLVLDD